MKRFIITLSVVLTLATSYSFAADVKVSSNVLQDFKTRFFDAENVKWSEANGYTIAEFTVEGEPQYAYYTSSGELAVVAQPLVISQLSKAQQAGLKKEYKDFAIINVYKVEEEESTKVYAVVENSTTRIILSSTSKKWDVVKTSSK